MNRGVKAIFMEEKGGDIGLGPMVDSGHEVVVSQLKLALEAMKEGPAAKADEKWV